MWEELMEFRVPKSLGVPANLSLPRTDPNEAIMKLSRLGILEDKVAVRQPLGNYLGFYFNIPLPSATGTRVRLLSKS